MLWDIIPEFDSTLTLRGKGQIGANNPRYIESWLINLLISPNARLHTANALRMDQPLVSFSQLSSDNTRAKFLDFPANFYVQLLSGDVPATDRATHFCILPRHSNHQSGPLPCPNDSFYCLCKYSMQIIPALFWRLTDKQTRFCPWWTIILFGHLIQKWWAGRFVYRVNLAPRGRQCSNRVRYDRPILRQQINVNYPKSLMWTISTGCFYA
jgi:hypothetical protein